MAFVERSALVEHSAKEMYDLVNDIESYPQFLPWCGQAEIHDQSENEITASILIRKGPISQSFTTCNALDPGKTIKMSLKEGPFRHLKGEWIFQSLAEHACKVTLKLEFEFSSGLIASTFGIVFEQIANTMVDAFVKRARQVYAK